MIYPLNMREVTYALSEALDLVGIDDTLHGKRVAYMAAELAKEMNFSQEEIDDIIFAGMIHDCGVSSTDVHTHLINELDWNNAQEHAINGEKLLQKTDIYKKYATYIRYHHTHWDMLPENLSKVEKYFSNILYLVDRVDALRAQMLKMNTRTMHSIEETLKKYSGSMFSEEIVAKFLKVSSRNSFWFYLEDESLEEYLHEWISKGANENISFENIREIALMFAHIVDAKSQFTSEHSIRVSALSRCLAELFDLSQESCEKIELAALLHDLGKLRVDDAVLNKPNVLNADEKLTMNRHSFDTDIILRKIKGFEEISSLASMHHEKLDGKGYPYNLEEMEIPFEARIITVADIFQALIQDRPYRNGLDTNNALTIVQSMCQNHELDPKVVAMLQANIEKCFACACNSESA